MNEIDIDSVGKNEDMLNADEAIIYLSSIGIRIKKKTLHNRMNDGTGPARYKRGGRLYFKKADLDAWKRNETKSYKAYERVAS